MLHERPPAAAAFASEDVLASGGASGAIELWDAGSGELLSQMHFRGTPPRHLRDTS